jgi:hypothetical protein
MIRWWVLALVCLTAPVLAQDVHHASAGDCTVLGSALDGKSFEMFSNSYGADCDWKSMGIDVKISPPPEGKYFEGVKTSFSPLSYSDDGLKASFNRYLDGNAGPTSYFKTGYACTAEKSSGQWHSTGCRMRYIT